MSPAALPARGRTQVLTMATLTLALTALTAPALSAHAVEVVEDGPALVLEKRNDADRDGVFSDSEDVPGAGSAVTFQVVLTNASRNEVTVTSMTDTMLDTTLDLIGEGHCPAFAGLTLAPDETEACTFTLDKYLRTYGPQPREQLTNVVHVVASDGEQELRTSDGSTVVNPNARKISVEVDKSNDADGDRRFSDDEQAPAAGTDVPFQVVVRNTSPGSVVLTELTDHWPGLDEPIDLLESCPTLDGMKLFGGGHDVDGDELDASGHDDGHDDGHEGGHERPTSATCTFTLGGYAPAAGESLTDTVAATVTKGHSPDRSATATDTSTVRTAPEQVVASPSVALEKRVGPGADGPFGDHDEAPGLEISVPEGGAPVFYELEVTNTGNTVLTDIALDDADVDLDPCTIPTELAPAGRFACVVGPVSALAGPQVNEATVTATGAGTPVGATDAAHYRGTAVAPAAAARPAISLAKVADITPDADGIKYVRYDPRDADEESVTYLFTIENTGETPLTGVTLTDDRLGRIALLRTTLDVDQTLQVEVTHVVDAEDAAAGAIRNTATVRGTAPDGATVTAEATEAVTVLEVRGADVRRGVLPRAGAPILALGIVGAATLASGLSLVLVERSRRRR